MDAAQLTGATSSYARKYALNGLFCIDDNKDADSNEQRQQIENKPAEKLSKEDQKKVKEYAEKYGYSAESICQAYKVKSLGDFNADMARPVCEQ
ncbi:ERF superfamily protein [Vibrio phage V039C]|nr:ERF superfamily protein [Vibrio phage V039C]QJD54558.1 ERF superfamily protein [Vibrio phage phiV039C]